MNRPTLLLAVIVSVAAGCAGAVDTTTSPTPQVTPVVTTAVPTLDQSPASASTPAASVPGVASPRSLSSAPPAGTPSAAEADVSIVNFMFEPDVTQVSAGTTIRWTNRDAAGHTVTSGPADEPDGRFDSGGLEQGQSFEMTFDEAGTYEFYCDFHPRMTGQIEVSP